LRSEEGFFTQKGGKIVLTLFPVDEEGERGNLNPGGEGSNSVVVKSGKKNLSPSRQGERGKKRKPFICGSSQERGVGGEREGRRWKGGGESETFSPREGGKGKMLFTELARRGRVSGFETIGRGK